jgi:hypothetical protein
MKKPLKILLIRFKYDKAGSYSYQHLSYFVLCPRVVDKYIPIPNPCRFGDQRLGRSHH